MRDFCSGSCCKALHHFVVWICLYRHSSSHVRRRTSQSMVLWCVDIVSRTDIITNANTMHIVKWHHSMSSCLNQCHKDNKSADINFKEQTFHPLETEQTFQIVIWSARTFWLGTDIFYGKDGTLAATCRGGTALQMKANGHVGDLHNGDKVYEKASVLTVEDFQPKQTIVKNWLSIYISL